MKNNHIWAEPIASGVETIFGTASLTPGTYPWSSGFQRTFVTRLYGSTTLSIHSLSQAQRCSVPHLSLCLVVVPQSSHPQHAVVSTTTYTTPSSMVSWPLCRDTSHATWRQTSDSLHDPSNLGDSTRTLKKSSIQKKIYIILLDVHSTVKTRKNKMVIFVTIAPIRLILI